MNMKNPDMNKLSVLLVVIPLLFVTGLVAAAVDDAELRREFEAPSLRWQSRPLWFWNGKLDSDKTKAMVNDCKASGYYGMGILPCKGMGVDFMSPEFLQHYKVAVDEAGKLGMKMCLYDEFWFPSGSAGGLLAKKHPEALSRRLDMLATDVVGPKDFTQAVPQGTLMGAVAMETNTHQRLDITASIKDGALRWNVPAGAWKVMIFTCVRDGGKGLVDYLEPKAVDAFIKLTYQAYHDAMPEHFGTTIDGAFYDEPAFYHVNGGRAWTDRFNEHFTERFKTNPITLYPSLWFDIGPDTAAARNALFGMRAELFATGFVKTISDWCSTHKMDLTGHADQEEVVNPVIGTVGDLIKSFKYQSIPGIDQVFKYGRASSAYKVVSSAANNYDRPQVVTECYGGINLPLPNLYKEAMDQFAKGINTMVPHAVWYDPAKIVFKPDLSPGAPTYGPELPAYNQYIGRLQRLLQGGRHVADIGVLYPIATLQAGSWFGPGDPYKGCVAIPEADYMQVGEALSLGVRRDFTFVHPEILEERCAVDGATIKLNNKVNHERWRAFIIPGSRCINISTLRFIKKFYDQGGTVIATTCLPDRAAELGADGEVRQLVVDIFGDQKSCHRNAQGGKAWFLPSPDVAALKSVLGEALPEGDVVIEQEIPVNNGNFSYIHKVKDGKSIYFFGNSSDTAVDTWVSLRGKFTLETWNPHDGTIGQAEVEGIAGKEGPVTRVHVKLAPVRSLFLVAGDTARTGVDRGTDMPFAIK
jgi:alpha-L-rhamnosidase